MSDKQVQDINVKEKQNIRTYRDLQIWQKSHELTRRVLYVCRKLPTNAETNVIKSQVLRAVTSIPANIAEGYGSHKGKGFVSYLRVARGTVTETDYWLYLLFDLGYIEDDIYNDLSELCTEEVLMLTSMISKIAGDAH